jgi:hypothetical protein
MWWKSRTGNDGSKGMTTKMGDVEIATSTISIGGQGHAV